MIRSRNLAPVSRAGNCRVFAEADVTFIGAQIRRIDAERELPLRSSTAEVSR